MAATTLRLRAARTALAWAILGALGAGEAWAGPWTRPPGGYFAKLSASYLYTRTELDARGDEVDLLTSNPLVQDAAYREVVLSSYVEYGWREQVSLVGSLPFKIATSSRTEISDDASLTREIDVTNAGFSDLHVGVRGAITRGRIPCALQAGVKIPLGYEKVPDNGGPALGTGEVDAALALAAGFAGGSVYASAWTGYRVRGGELDDDAGFGVETGGRAGRAFARVLVEGWYSTGATAPLEVSATTVAANQDVLKLVASAGVRMDPGTSIAAEAYHVLDGRNTAAGTTFAISLAFAR